MAPSISVGDEAPNFDLTSTEDVLLMLRDEVPRMAVLLYFFTGPASERSRSDLAVLAAAKRDLARKLVVVLGVSPAKLPELKALQRELSLPFPLLVDDRDFSSAYGIEAASDESEAASALFLVDRQQRVVWMANPVEQTEADLPRVLACAGKLPGPTANTPRSVINRVVDWWVNRFRKPRVIA